MPSPDAVQAGHVSHPAQPAQPAQPARLEHSAQPAQPAQPASPPRLAVAAGQYSAAGRKPANEDFHGLRVPGPSQLATKGVAMALADGISSSESGRQASQAAVTSFLSDYFCTSDAWSVRRSAERVIAAANAWLFAQTQRGQGRYDKDRGWVCTFSALVIKSRTAHLFHVGDARIWQLQGRTLEPLTRDHRVHAGGGQSYLGRALGIAGQVEIDYRRVPLQVGDTFVLTTDGVHGYVSPTAMAAALARHAQDLDAAARAIAESAILHGSEDNVTVQVLRIAALPQPQATEVSLRAAELPLPPLLAPGRLFDGWRIVRELHASSRSHIHLAVDEATGRTAVLKTPSIDLQADPAYRERFLLEEWVARRLDNVHLLKAFDPERPRGALYIAMEHAPGCTLAQWMLDHPHPSLEAVRSIVEQLARGLRAMHRAETLHQDLRPDNVMVDATGTVKIIDFGACRVAGVMEMQAAPPAALPGTAQYMAPEYFLGADPTPLSDLYSLAAIAYWMLTGTLAYGMEMPKCRSRAQQHGLRLRSVLEARPELPAWLDGALRKALHPDPSRRPADVMEFAASLRRPDAASLHARRPPLAERDPVVFWKGMSLLLGLGWLLLFGAWWNFR